MHRLSSVAWWCDHLSVTSNPCWLGYFCTGILLQQGLDGRVSVLSALRICYSATEADHEEGPVSHISAATAQPECNSFDWHLTLFYRFYRCSPSQPTVSPFGENSDTLESRSSRTLWGHGFKRGWLLPLVFFQWPLKVLQPENMSRYSHR